MLDLLPGGFEVEANALRPGRGAVPGGNFAEVGEDRNVFFLGLENGGSRAFPCRVKPVAAGVFALPPVCAESLYDLSVKARSSAGRIEVLPEE